MSLAGNLRQRVALFVEPLEQNSVIELAERQANPSPLCLLPSEPAHGIPETAVAHQIEQAAEAHSGRLMSCEGQPFRLFIIYCVARRSG